MTTDLLQTGAAWLEGQRNAHMAHTVTYSRGVLTVDLLATRCRKEYEVEDYHGVMVIDVMTDWLIIAADIVLDGSVTAPAGGDEIAETVGETTETYEVMPIGGAPAFDYSDHNTLRIHTKRMATE